MSLSPTGEQYKAAADAKLDGWTDAARLMVERKGDMDTAYAMLCRLLDEITEPDQLVPLLALAIMRRVVSQDDLTHLDFNPQP